MADQCGGPAPPPAILALACDGFEEAHRRRPSQSPPEPLGPGVLGAPVKSAFACKRGFPDARGIGAIWDLSFLHIEDEPVLPVNDV